MAKLKWKTSDGYIDCGNTFEDAQFDTLSKIGESAGEPTWNGGAWPLRLSNMPSAPANNAAGTVGDIILDAAGGYIYICTGLGGTSNWKRVALSTY